MPELDFEKIAALRPDLILGVDSGVPWQEATTTIGAALGRSERAAQLVADVQGQFDAVRDAHSEWAGRIIAVATYGADDLGVFASQDLRSRFFTDLGFQVPATFDELAVENEDFFPRATIASNPLIGQLDATQQGRVVVIGEHKNAFAWNSVLSLPVALEGIVPMLEQAVEAGR